jgi:hypothetical protein
MSEETDAALTLIDRVLEPREKEGHVAQDRDLLIYKAL